MVFVWGYYSNLFEDFAQCDLGFSFDNVKLKFDTLVEWHALADNVVEIWYLCEVIALICLKILLNAI